MTNTPDDLAKRVQRLALLARVAEADALADWSELWLESGDDRHLNKLIGVVENDKN